MSLYYYSDGTATPVGPIAAPEIQRLNATGIVAAQTPVFQDGTSDWRVYSDFFNAGPQQPATPAGVAPSVATSVAAGSGPALRMDSLTSALSPKTAAISFAVILLAMFLLPIVRVSVKGQMQSFRLIQSISSGSGGPTNLSAVVALLAPIVGIVVALMRRPSWRTVSGIVAAVGALAVFMATSRVTSMIQAQTSGMAGSETAIGGFLLPLALIALAVVCLMPLFKSRS